VLGALALAQRATRLRPAVAVTALAAAALAGSVAFGAAPNRGEGPAAGFLHGRTDTWAAALETFADRPVLGTGADAFLAGSARHQDGQTILFAHDLPLELMVELGIAGLLLALALYATTARTIWATRRSARMVWLLGPAAAVFPVTSLVDWQWHLAGAGAVWALAVGGLAGAAPGTEKSDGPASPPEARRTT
jgi:O-antigen ligase